MSTKRKLGTIDQTRRSRVDSEPYETKRNNIASANKRMQRSVGKDMVFMGMDEGVHGDS